MPRVIALHRYPVKGFTPESCEALTVLAEDALDDRGRKCISAAIQDYVLGLAENPLAGHPVRLPLRLAGDGDEVCPVD